MKKSKIFSLIFLILSVTALIYFSTSTTMSVKTTLELYIEKVFPSLFLFTLFTHYITVSGLIYNVSYALSFLSRILRINKNMITPIILSYICGFPSAAIIINNMYKDGKISYNETKFLCTFTNNASPVFILATVGITILNDEIIGKKLLFIHILSSIIIAIIYYRYFFNKNIIQENINNLKDLSENLSHIGNNSSILNKVLINTFKSMLNILFYMIIFNVFADVLNSYNIPYIKYVTSTFELTKGISFFSNSNNYAYISFLLGFSSFSVIFQIKSSYTHFHCPIYKTVFFKLLHGIISYFLYFVIF